MLHQLHRSTNTPPRQLPAAPQAAQRQQSLGRKRRPWVTRALCLSPILLTFSTGCLCPPCEGAGDAAGATGPAKKVASGARELIWDGDSAGGKAQGWSDCDDKPNCKTKLGPAAGEGVDGSTALHFHGEGKKWIGMGWNWFGWWPKNAGIDISPYDTLAFSMRLVSPDPKNAPTPASMTVALRCSTGEKNSASVSLEKYLKNPADGKWHDVEIPLAEFYKGKEGKEFDPKSAWELNFGTWASSSRTFDVYLDNIAAVKK